MFPIQNSVPSRYAPVATWVLISVNCLIFVVQDTLSPRELEQFFIRFALIPAFYFGTPAASLLTVVDKKPVKDIDDQTLILADVGRKAIEQVKHAARELLSRRLPPKRAAELADTLSTGTWTRDYPIFASAAKTLGLPVNIEMPKEIMELMTLYPQPVRMQGGGVEYLPEPRQKHSSRSR